MLLVTGSSFRQCSGIPPFSTQPFTYYPLLAVAGRKEDEVNQGAILRAIFALGIFYFQEKVKMRQLRQMENGCLTNGLSLCSN